MKKVAVFGNAGGGKSTVSRNLAELTGLPLYVLDKIQFKPGGIPIPDADFQLQHEQILAQDRWLIDGFGSPQTLWPRLDAADCLVYIDFPIRVHGWWITKRLFQSFIKTPPGWPENSPIWRSSISSYKALWLCHQYLTPKYRDYVSKASLDRQVYHLTSVQELPEFYQQIQGHPS